MPLFLRGVDLRVAGVLHDPQRDSSSAQHPKARLTPARIEAKLRAAPSDAPLGHGQQRASLLCGPRRPSQTERSVLRYLTPPARRVPPSCLRGASKNEVGLAASTAQGRFHFFFAELLFFTFSTFHFFSLRGLHKVQWDGEMKTQVECQPNDTMCFECPLIDLLPVYPAALAKYCRSGKLL